MLRLVARCNVDYRELREGMLCWPGGEVKAAEQVRRN